MPVSSLGNINFINQNVGVHSNHLSNELAKDGFASLSNMQNFNEIRQKVDKKLERVNKSSKSHNTVNEKQENEQSKRDKNSFFANDEEKKQDEEIEMDAQKDLEKALDLNV